MQTKNDTPKEVIKRHVKRINEENREHFIRGRRGEGEDEKAPAPFPLVLIVASTVIVRRTKSRNEEEDPIFMMQIKQIESKQCEEI